MSDRRRRLLIAVPVAPGGSIHVELWRWLMAVAAESEMKRNLRKLHGLCEDFRTRIELNRIIKGCGGEWMVRQAKLLWSDPAAVAGIMSAGPFVPEGWDVDAMVHPGRPIATNRNDISRKFLWTPHYDPHQPEGAPDLIDTDFDAVLMCDSDIAPEHHHLHLICEALDRTEVDVVSGVYCMVNEDDGVPIPIVYEQTGPGHWRDRPGKSANLLLVGEGDLRTAPGIGVPAGFLAIKRFALEEMVRQDRVWFKDRFHDGSLEAFEIKAVLKQAETDPAAALTRLREIDRQATEKDWGTKQSIGGWAFGEDIWFCRQVQEAGFKVWIDRRISLRHYHDIDLRGVHRMGQNRHFEGMMRAWGLDVNDPKQLEDGRSRFSAMMEGEARKRDAEMRAVAEAARKVPKLQGATP